MGGCPVLPCSWRDPLLFLKSDLSDWKVLKQREEGRRRTEGKCFLLSALRFWQEDHPWPLLPLKRSTLPDPGHTPNPSAKHTAHPSLLPHHFCPSASFSYASIPNLSIESALFKETRNLCSSATIWKTKGRFPITNVLNC